MKYSILFLFLIIAFLAIFSRFFLLSLRPLHHDEGVNYFFANNIFQHGAFLYDPANYHGPLYFFLLYASFLVFGISEFSLRLPAALFGVLLITLPFFLIQNKKYAFSASLLLLFSPSLTYYSRYSIHETSFVFFTTLLILLFTKFLEKSPHLLAAPRPRDSVFRERCGDKQKMSALPYMALAAALLVSTKETSILPLGIVFLLTVINYKRRIKSMPWKNNVPLLITSILLFIFVYISVFTSFFTNFSGLLRSWQGYLPWLARGFQEIGHQKPFWYYASLLFKTELPLVLLSLSAWYIMIRGKTDKSSMLPIHISVWLVITFLVYSSIGYKAPWLIINITAPLAFLAAWGVENISRIWLQRTVLVLSISYMAVFSFYYNYAIPWQSKNPFAYVHTSADVKELSNKINTVAETNSKILIVSDDYWPLPFYLREKHVEYLSETPLFAYESYSQFSVFIVRDKIFNQNKIPKDFIWKKYILRQGVHLFLVFPKSR